MMHHMNKRAYILLSDILSLQSGGRKKMKSNKSNKLKIGRPLSEQKNMPTYTEHLSEPWFSLITLGLKTVEGRRNKGRFKDVRIGETIEWVNDDFKRRTVLTKIVGKNEYATFEEYLLAEGLDRCLPGMKTIEDGLSVYYKYFTKEDEHQYGVVAILLKVV